jgi:NAD(P) transhydrogenase
MNQRDCTARTTGEEGLTLEDLLARTQHVIGREIEVIRSQAQPQRGWTCLHGTARFEDAHTVLVESDPRAPPRSPVSTS